MFESKPKKRKYELDQDMKLLGNEHNFVSGNNPCTRVGLQNPPDKVL